MTGSTSSPSLRRLLARPAYRRLWLARTVSQIGDVAQFTALGLLLVTLTGSGLGVAGAVVAEILPVLLLAPLAGSLVDRLPRVRVMVAADLVRVLLAAILAVWHGDVVVAYAVAFGLSAGQVFFSPAAQSLLPAVVEDEELVAANSGIWTAAVTAQILVARPRRCSPYRSASALPSPSTPPRSPCRRWSCEACGNRRGRRRCPSAARSLTWERPWQRWPPCHSSKR